MNSPQSQTINRLNRRNFLKLATGTVVGAALFTMPAFRHAGVLAKSSHSVKPVHFELIPTDAIETAKASPLVHDSYESIVKYVNSITNTTLKNAVLDLIQNPMPTFMENYTSDLSIRQLYAKLAVAGLIDTSAISQEHLLPPFGNRSLQPFMTAPGSGYGSHHNYPGGLMTHVNANLHITDYICRTYTEVFSYSVHRNIAIAAQALHDIAKPFVFQWQSDGSSLKEYTIAGQGAHHTISLAEVIYRDFPVNEVIAQACAHGAPSSTKEEEAVVAWLKAAAYMAHKDPVAYGLITSSGRLPSPHRQEGYIVHLGDHDWVLSVPAAQKTVIMLKNIASQDYGMTKDDLQGAKFNHFRNYIGAQLSFMYLNMLAAEPYGLDLVRKEVNKIILK